MALEGSGVRIVDASQDLHRFVRVGVQMGFVTDRTGKERLGRV